MQSRGEKKKEFEKYVVPTIIGVLGTSNGYILNEPTQDAILSHTMQHSKQLKKNLLKVAGMIGGNETMEWLRSERIVRRGDCDLIRFAVPPQSPAKYCILCIISTKSYY